MLSITHSWRIGLFSTFKGFIAKVFSYSYLKVISCLILTIFLNSAMLAQTLDTLSIRIVSEGESADDDMTGLEKGIKEEVGTLLLNRKIVTFKTDYCKCDAAGLNETLNKAFEDEQTDVVIALGAFASAVLSQRSTYPKPAIASIVIDNKLQNVPLSTEGTSGINNFTYVQSPFSFEKDLKILHEVYPFKNIGIITSPSIDDLFPNFSDLFRKTTDELNTRFTKITADQNVMSTLESLDDDVDAVYVFPLFDELKKQEEAAFFDALISKGLPSVALLGESMVAKGAMMGYKAEDNLAKIPRRIALDILKIVDGQNASELPVLINTFSEAVVINMNTVRKVGTYPGWDMMAEAIIYNLNEVETDRQLSLQTVVMEALDQNLSLRVAGVEPLLAGKEIELAKAELLPQIDASSSFSVIDKNSSLGSFGTRGRLNLAVGGALSQVVYAEPALANVAIQELLQKGEQYGLTATQLDVVLDAASLYLSVLQAQSFMEIQASNVGVTRNNLDIAKAKDAVGYSGATDLNRWKSELALGKIDLNDAQAQFEQAKYALNQFLNRPINEAFKVEDIGITNNLLMITDDRFINRINNEKELDQLSDFFVEEALYNLPELKQIDFALLAQERLLKSNKRAFYLPTVGLSGNVDHTLKRWDLELMPGIQAQALEPTWNLGLGIQYPIFQGNSRRINQEVSELNIAQTKDQRADTRNQLELRVRVAVQKASASYFSVLRFEEATKAAIENFDIVQDAYSQGLVSVTNLIDAQNARIQTELGAVNAGYQFILDFLELERSIGFYYLLSTPSEHAVFFDRLTAYMAQKNEGN